MWRESVAKGSTHKRRYSASPRLRVTLSPRPPVTASPRLRVGLLFLLFLLLPGLALAQSVEKPRLKEFGSSLKKLKWDPQKNAVTETNSGPSSEDDEVVKIDTSLVVSEILVLDRQGRPIQGLKESDFLITEEGTPQQVGHF